MMGPEPARFLRNRFCAKIPMHPFRAEELGFAPEEARAVVMQTMRGR